MKRSSDQQRAERINAAQRLLARGDSLAEAAGALTGAFGISRRQAYRYLREARDLRTPLAVPDAKIAFTVKLSRGLVGNLRRHATATGLTLSELVTQALEAFLHKGP